MDIDENRIIDWALKYHQGHLSDEDRFNLERWLDEGRDHADIFNHYRKLYCQSRSIVFIESVNRQRAWTNISSVIHKKARRFLPVWTSYVAAVLVLVLLSSYFLWNKGSRVNYQVSDYEQIAEAGCRRAILTLADGSRRQLEKENKQIFDERDGTKIVKDSTNNLVYSKEKPISSQTIYNEIEVPRAGEYSLSLADGTRVWLNADSKLRYPVHFNGKQRVVYLEGEAYFEVAHDKEKPFVISAHDTRIKVLGTKFNVSAYKDQSYIATTLAQGSVQIDYLKDRLILEPGKQSVIHKGEEGIAVNEVDPSMYISWIHGIFEFEKRDLASITEQLGRWYNVNFFFTEPHLKHIQFTGVIKRNKSIKYAIELIESITDVTFKIEGENIMIEK